jgi:hypothetical protein
MLGMFLSYTSYCPVFQVQSACEHILISHVTEALDWYHLIGDAFYISENTIELVDLLVSSQSIENIQ